MVQEDTGCEVLSSSQQEWNKEVNANSSQVATPQNGQAHSNNSSVICRLIVWVCLIILWCWRVKGYSFRFKVVKSKTYPKRKNNICGNSLIYKLKTAPSQECKNFKKMKFNFSIVKLWKWFELGFLIKKQPTACVL